MGTWIAILILLSGIITLLSADEKTFCRERSLKCNEKQFRCPQGHVISIAVLYYLPGTECHTKIQRPDLNHTAWENCCCQENFTDLIYRNNGYENKLREGCDNKTSCSVYEFAPLHRVEGKVTILYNCRDPQEAGSTTAGIEPPSTPPDTPHKKTTIPSTKTTTDIIIRHKTARTPTENDSKNVPVIIGCTVTLTVIIAVIVIVACYRKRRTLNYRNTNRDDKSVHEAELDNQDYYSEIEPYGAASSNHGSVAAASSLVVAGDGCEYSVVNQNNRHMRADVHGTPGVYDSVSMTQKNPVRSDATYDHVVHRAPDKPDMTYDQVGDLNRKPENTDIDNTYNTCVAHANDSLTNNQQQRGVFKVDDDNAYSHITTK